MPRLPGQQQQSPYYASAQQQHQQPQQQYAYRSQLQTSFQPSGISTAYPMSTQYPNSPVSPLGTPGGISPTASKSYYHTRQIRPLYVPAVLRPTEFPSKEPPTRPKPEDDEDSLTEQDLRPNSSFMSLGGLTAFGRLSRRSTGDSAKCIDADWDLDQFPKPTGAPTREHWKPDQESTMCDHPACKRTFSYFTRRHHCRKCGNIFCDQHSAFEIPLDQDANFNPRGVPSRACGYCYMQFKQWRNLASSNNSQRGSQDAAPGADRHHRLTNSNPASPISASPTVSVLSNGLPPHTPDAAQSVPRDWNWSTF
ncbi:uncharacterized protein THITE_2118504 [Thermothielavioides terrestris NRRL 8126]|uniref:FYVE-type domain-containing protein n=2 Tax=Thermothielavioides terrestris TaxID=2587410 RepID=G2RA28_THETT|nr:uncharacterized protein THITE_2118504 [Thermothielavioides terrestris NRRL 8126]AEO68813.1 hypothetical protein THITE_2118504 [Thermothielavioides terrestris NRRL 8126]